MKFPQGTVSTFRAKASIATAESAAGCGLAYADSAVEGERRKARAGLNARWSIRVALVAALAVAAIGTAPATAARLGHHARPMTRGATFFVGAAKADVTPQTLTGFYLGGYGIGPVHQAKSVLRDIYFRAIAIRDKSGHQVVIGALDSQAYSVAYQQGPYGFSDVERYIQQRLGIPAGHIVLQATHSHNGPDEIGIWGGVPNSYLKFVAAQMEAAILAAVSGERPARIHVGTADMTGFSHTFGSNTDPTRTGDQTDYPIDQQLRVLQAVSPKNGRVIATLVNYSTHATVYGPLDKVSPDWPGATATYLEHDERGMARKARYGYPGSTAIVTVGAVGHSWPAGTPRGTNARLDPFKATDDNYPADHYGNAVARMAIGALSHGRGFWLGRSLVNGTEQNVSVLNTNPVLLATILEPFNSTALGGYKVFRADTPPWAIGDVFVAPVTALRVGGLALFSVPGEPYPSVKFSLNQDVGTRLSFIFGLAQDQLGYVEELADYNGALQCSASDEWFFTISPLFGSDVVRLQLANARALGFPVSGNAPPASGLGPLPPSLNCTLQALGQAGEPAG
jgi:hypothetical protein